MADSIAKQIVAQYKTKMVEAKWTFLKGIHQLYKTGKIDKEELRDAMSHLNPAHITTQDAGLISECSIGASFRILITQSIAEKSYLKIFKIAPGMNDKIADGRFVNALGYPIPKIINSSPSDEAANCVGYIIKPTNGAGAKGVFLVNDNNLHHLFDKKNYSKEEFMSYCTQNKWNRFIVEEYVGNDDLIRDLKFYMFYGEVGAVLEIQRGQEKDLHCYYDADGNIVKTGQYEDSWFEGAGFSEAEKSCAIALSQSIPSPYIRIDLISNGVDYHVGELTAHPGLFETFSHEWDSFFEKKFLEARARLLEDLLLGKRFDAYLNRYDQP